MCALWIGATAADLVPRKNVCPVHSLTLFIGDAVHVGCAFEPSEIGNDVAFPYLVGPTPKPQNGTNRINSVPIVGDVADARFPEHDFDTPRIRRPDRKPQVGVCGPVRENLSSAKA